MNNSQNNTVEVKYIKKRRNIFLSILIYFLVFLFGFVSAFGVTALVVYQVVAKKSINEVDDFQAGFTGSSIKELEILSDEACEGTLLDLFTLISNKFEGESTLSDFTDISPILSTKVDELVKKINDLDVITIDVDKLKSTQLSKLGEFLQDTVEQTEVAKILFDSDTNYSTQNELLMRLCFGDDYVVNEDNTVTGTRTTISNISTRFEELINNIEIADFTDVDPNSAIMMYLAYGKFDKVKYTYTAENQIGVSADETILYDSKKLTATKVGDDYYLKKNTGTDAYTDADGFYLGNDGKKLTIEDVTLYNGETEVRASKVDEISSKLNTIYDDLTLDDLLTIDSTSPKVLQSLKTSTLNGFSNDLNVLPLKDIIEISDDDKILCNLKSSTLNTLNDDINNLTVQDLYYTDIYSTYVLATSYESGVNYYTTTDNVNYTKCQALTEFESGVDYYTGGNIYGIWKYLLIKDGTEQFIKIQEFDSAMDNVKENISKASLADLKTDGFLSGNLDKNLTYNGVTKNLGEFTIDELIGYINQLP